MRRPFGQLGDGTPVHAYTLGHGDGLWADILDFGGTLHDLSFPGRHGRTQLILQLDTARAYARGRAYLGAVVGRFANRIAGARFELDGRTWPLSANAPPHHLHGGFAGFGQRMWRVLGHDESTLHLAYTSPAGEEGYPGTLEAEALYTLQGDALTLALSATTDAPTPVNLTCHPYFNLAGTPQVPAWEQQLTVHAAHYLPAADASLAPSGEIAPVDATPFDLRRPRRFADAAGGGHPQLALAGGIDHCLVVEPRDGVVAELASVHSGLALAVSSNQPGLQVYGAQGLEDSYPGLGRGICLEPQAFPDAPNQPAFPDAILRPGQRYEHMIGYRVRRLD